VARAFTTLGAGADAEHAYRAAREQGGPLASTTAVRQVAVPDGADASRFATWVQRVAQDAGAAGDVPDGVRPAVEQAAASLLADPATCLAVEMEGALAERVKARAAAAADARAYLLFGLAPEE
jgi:hypothetical protein